MDHLLDIASAYAGLFQHVRDTSEDRLGVIAARRQDLAGHMTSLAGEEDKIGKSAAHIDAKTTRKISVHSLFTSPTVCSSGPPDITRNLLVAHIRIIERLGCGPENRPKLNVSARNIGIFRDPRSSDRPAQEHHTDGALDRVAAMFSQKWRARIAKQYGQQRRPGPAILGECSARDYTDTATRNSKTVRSAIDGGKKRRKPVWEIHKKSQEHGARPIIYHFRAATSSPPEVAGLTIMPSNTTAGASTDPC